MPDPSRSSSEIGPSPLGVRASRILFWSGAAFTTLGAPWMLGGQPLATQWWLLWGAALTFGGGVLVRLIGGSTRGSEMAGRVQALALLFGLLFLGLLFLQARNPSLRVVISGNLWTLSPLGNVAPGPHSIRAPFDSIPGDWLPYKNAWRYLLIYGAGWLFSAGLALGLAERKDAVRWVRLVAGNAVLLALVCIAHRVSGARETLWRFADTFDFTGSPVFFYKNHNGAYLALSLAAVLAVATRETGRVRRRLWEGAALLVWIATVLVNSRVATGCATLFGLLYLVRAWLARRAEGHSVLTPKIAAIALASVLGVGGLIVALGGGRAVGRFGTAFTAPLDFLQGGGFRTLTRQVGLEMWKDEPLWGWGGGSYMYLFNTYQVRVPAVAHWVYREQPNLNRFVAPGLNCDWVEFLVEYGVLGVGLLSAALAVAVGSVFRWRRGAPAEAKFLLAGVVGVVIHAYFDYVLRNPAILLLLLGALVTAVRLAVPGKRATSNPRPATAASSSPAP